MARLVAEKANMTFRGHVKNGASRAAEAKILVPTNYGFVQVAK